MRLTGVLLLFACQAGHLPATEQAGEDPRSADVRIAQGLRALLAEAEPSVESLLRRFPGADLRGERDLGAGARRLVLVISGQETSSFVALLAESASTERPARIACVRIDQQGYAQSWGRIEAGLRSSWGPGVRELEHGLRLEHQDTTLLAALAKRRDTVFGLSAEREVPEDLQPALELLLSPFEHLCLGQSFGDDGGPPDGQLEIRALVGAGRWDLVGRVLRGWNPEGRVYAAHALLVRQRGGQALDASDVAAVKVIERLATKYACCAGCEVFDQAFDKAIEHLDGR